MTIKPSTYRSQIRNIVGVGQTHNNVPIRIVPGDSEPRLRGTRGGWFTRGGTRIVHPGSYGKKGWSNMIYKTSTRRIVVGLSWLVEYVDGDALRIAS